MSGTEVADYCGGTKRPIGTSVNSVLLKDAMILKEILQRAILASPDSFLKRLEDVDDKGADYWIDQIQSSTWVVAQQNGKVVGMATCKPPDRGEDEESHQDSRYIESVWIDPDLRGQRLGERLIGYLMAAESRKNPGIRQFLLWVFEANLAAISLYKRMDFVLTDDRHGEFRPEIKYRLVVTRGDSVAIRRSVDKTLGDREKDGVTYRVLGEGDSA